MALTLSESQAASELANFLYDFLPGKPHPYGDTSLSFPAAAAAVGVGHFWPGGSKGPSLARLLTQTLEHEPGRFCQLILEIVRRAIIYRRTKQKPLASEDIAVLNQHLLTLHFRIPDLHESAFLSSLPSRPSADVPQDNVIAPEVLAQLQRRLVGMSALPHIQRGFAFERFLNEFFSTHHLEPRNSFRLIGEQIDGSFDLDGNIYLVEAKWQNEPVGEAALLIFSGKVGGKAKWSRGLFISMGTFSAVGLEAFCRGRQTDIVCVDGLDLYHILEGHLDLCDVIRRKARRAAETNEAFVPVRDLYLGLV